MEALPRIWVDWNDMHGDIVELDLPYTIEHFVKQGIPIEVGRKIRLFGDELEADAIIVEYQPHKVKFLGAKIVEGTMIDVSFPESGEN
jgi:hypothetical protein